LEKQPLLLDDCVVINLCATDLVRQIAEANRADFAVVREAAAESLFVEVRSEGGNERRAIDVAALQAAGALVLLELTAVEIGTFVEFATELDDGEAATIAVAKHRTFRLASDDRRALSFIAERQLAVQVIRTSDLILGWATQARVERAEIGRVLRLIRDCARFEPGAVDPNVAWWREHISQ